MDIHPTALVHPEAKLGDGVQVGPFCIVEADVEIGAGTVMETRSVVKSGSRVGCENRIFESAVVGGAPQHLHVPEVTGGVQIGDRNSIREHATIHRAMKAGDCTVVGSGNMIMVNTHIGHDCVIGDNTVLINNTMIAGHVHIEDRAYIAGGSGVQQFRRVGKLATIGGQARVTKDVAPYVMLDGINCAVVGLNKIGLRRAGYSPADVEQIRAAYQLIFRSGLAWKEVMDRLPREFPTGPAAEFQRFFATGRYGFATERRMPLSATLPIDAAMQQGDAAEQPELRVKTG